MRHMTFIPLHLAPFMGSGDCSAVSDLHTVASCALNGSHNLLELNLR
jgi:hypothetical protein